MGDPKQTVGQELGQLFSKLFIWTVYIGLAVITKLAVDSRAGKLTRKEIVIKVILSIFSGVMAKVACDSMGYEKWSILVVPVATLLGESVVVYFMTNVSVKAFFEKYVPWLFPKPKKK